MNKIKTILMWQAIYYVKILINLRETETILSVKEQVPQ